MTSKTLLKYSLLCCTLSSPGMSHANIQNLPPLPEPVSNNAVAKVTVDGEDVLLSFMGLGAKKRFQDVHNKAWALRLGNQASDNNHWLQINSVPHANALAGRLASIAVGVGETAYLFGGYTVAEDHSEISTQDNYSYQLKTDSYQRIADMPVAVDDAALAIYQNRYIYLLGGWHQHGNVNLVQVYDIQTNAWFQASPIPAPAVFGQSAGIVGNELVLCDGVTVEARANQVRTFKASPVCLYGKIEVGNHLRIHWQALPHYSTAALNPNNGTLADKDEYASTPNTSRAAMANYRMASTGIDTTGQIVFLGGSNNPYNYNGIGYNGQPSEPSNQLHRFDLASHQWLTPLPLNQPSMDHRGLIKYQDYLLTIGGMLGNQEVTSKVIATKVPPRFIRKSPE